MSNTKRPWTPLTFHPGWAEFDYQDNGAAEGMVPLYEGHQSFDGEVTEYERTIAGYAPDEATAHLYSAAPDLYEALEDVCHCLQFFVAAIGERRPGWEDIHDVMFATAEGTAWDESAKALKAASEALQKAHPKRLEGIEPR